MKRSLLEVGLFAYKSDEKSKNKKEERIENGENQETQKSKKLKIDGDVQVSKFLNRLLGLDIGTQQALFQYFR